MKDTNHLYIESIVQLGTDYVNAVKASNSIVVTACLRKIDSFVLGWISDMNKMQALFIPVISCVLVIALSYGSQCQIPGEQMFAIK